MESGSISQSEVAIVRMCGYDECTHIRLETFRIGERRMTLLAEIETFPNAMREALETSFGIGSAEAFYEHAIRNPTGLALALSISTQQLIPLAQLVEGYLPAAFLTRCHKPVGKRKRGVIVPEERTESR